MNGYSGGANENEDWLISPAISLNLDMEYVALDLEFRTAKKYDGDPLRVLISTDYDGQGDPGTFTWNDLSDAFDFSAGDYEWVESGKCSLLNLAGVEYEFYIAFLYTSTAEAASSWEIDYVKVTAETTVSVNENQAQSVNIYPNPAREQVSFVIDEDAEVSLFDVTGRKVSTMNVAAGQVQLNVSELVDGVYFVNVRFANGGTAISKFVKF